MMYEFAKRSRSSDEGTASGGASRRSALVVAVGGVVVALGVNPYIAVMTALLVVAYAVDLAFCERRSRRFVIVVGVLGSAALALAAWFFGYIGRNTKDMAGPGFGQLSANLNTLVNPFEFSRFFLPLGSVGEWQSEGSAYLGVAGALGFVIAIIAASKSSDFRGRLRPFVPAACAAVLAFVFSLSHRITLGSRMVAEVPLHDVVLEGGLRGGIAAARLDREGLRGIPGGPGPRVAFTSRR
jgi:hypothetical protein